MYVLVINSSNNGFSSSFTANCETICRISFVAASLSKLAGYDKTYTTRVLYFMIITHSDPLCKLSLYIRLSPSFHTMPMYNVWGSKILPQTSYIGIVRNVLINICEYAKVLHIWNSFGLHTHAHAHTHTHNCTHTHTHTHTHTLSLSQRTYTHKIADLICMSFDNVHQLMDSNEALTVWYKLFMNEVSRHVPIRYKQVKHSNFHPG